MKRMLMLLTFVGMTASLQCACAALPHVKAELTYAPNVPPPITRTNPAIVEADLTATTKTMPLTSSVKYHFWTFNGHVPGPFIRVRAGDWLQVRISNTDTSGMPHNLDFHAATGPGGGANLLTVTPGMTNTAWLRLRSPGLFMYHCAIPPMIDHISNGMYGLILVEPTNGLPHADREFYIMQGEFYGTNNPNDDSILEYSHEHALNAAPNYVVFNGQSGSMFLNDALQAKAGDRVRLYFGDAGPNLISSFHIIGIVMENVFRDGSLADPPVHDLQTTLVSPGAAAVIEFTPVVPGMYTFIDHSAAHSEKGAMGQLNITGPATSDVFRSAADGPPTE